MQIDKKIFEAMIADAEKEYCVVSGEVAEGIAFGRLLALRKVAYAAGEHDLVEKIDRIMDDLE